jgi:hypothetical protein
MTIKTRLLNLFTDGVVWFAALSIASATGMLLADIVGH